MRLNAVASNMANADSVVSADGKPYRAKQVVFETTPMGSNPGVSSGVRVREVVEDASPPRMVFDPKNPAADEKGYVAFSNVNVVEEMTNMISASRSYQTNVEVMNTAKTMMLRTLQIGQG
jgi:flagellar basal-body rod protein FlgC